jgi:hypothetical protein
MLTSECWPRCRQSIRCRELSNAGMANVRIEPAAQPLVLEWAAVLGGEFRMNSTPPEA